MPVPPLQPNSDGSHNPDETDRHQPGRYYKTFPAFYGNAKELTCDLTLICAWLGQLLPMAASNQDQRSENARRSWTSK